MSEQINGVTVILPYMVFVGSFPLFFRLAIYTMECEDYVSEASSLHYEENQA